MARLEEQKVSGPGQGRTLFVPPMEPYCVETMTAVFRSIGYDTVILVETDETLALGLKHTGGGECVPCPTTTGALIKAMQDRGVPPEKAIFFMPTACGPCRFGQYAKLDQIIFDKLGWSEIRFMSPSAENAYDGLDMGVRQRLWHALIIGDIVRKLATRTRPYEKTPGETDRVIRHHFDKLVAAFERTDIAPVCRLLAEAVEDVKRIPVSGAKKPLVGIVGEIYVRCDPFINGQLIRRIEALGG